MTYIYNIKFTNKSAIRFHFILSKNSMRIINCAQVETWRGRVFKQRWWTLLQGNRKCRRPEVTTTKQSKQKKWSGRRTQVYLNWNCFTTNSNLSSTPSPKSVSCVKDETAKQNVLLDVRKLWMRQPDQWLSTWGYSWGKAISYRVYTKCQIWMIFTFLGYTNTQRFRSADLDNCEMYME